VQKEWEGIRRPDESEDLPMIPKGFAARGERDADQFFSLVFSLTQAAMSNGLLTN
jgi:hypothetical protein